MTFEESNSRLQEIINQLEKNTLGIEESTKLYEEAIKIAKDCTKILNDSKGKITILQNELNSLNSNNFDE